MPLFVLLMIGLAAVLASALSIVATVLVERLEIGL